MTKVWWGKESRPSEPARLVPGENLSGFQPELASSAGRAVVAEVRDRIKSYTPKWTNQRTTDAGVALVRLFGEQMEPVLKRLNRLPEKTLVEFLDTAGVQLLPPTPATALLEFEIADGAPESVLISRDFQVSAQPADGGGDRVVFETERSFFGAPAKIAELHVQQGSLFKEVDPEGVNDAAPLLPFGKKPIAGRALFIGLSGTVAPGPTLNLGIGVAAPPGAPPPVPSGGLLPLPILPPPLLRWEVLDGASYEPAEVVLDETGGLIRSGVVELRLPRRWRVGPRPEGLPGDEPLRWLRLRIVHGRYPEAPKLSSVRLNMVRASAVRTVRDEILEPVANSGGRRMRLSQTPVLPDSLILEVDDGSPDFEPLTEVDTESGLRVEATQGANGSSPPQIQQWQEVEDLAVQGSEDHVYELDPRSGELTFGDGVHGVSLPQGFRNVRAIRYRVGGGAAGTVDAEAISTQLTSVAFVRSVKNPFPATGGTDRETQPQALRRGPQEIRARGRAVTVADYALLATRAPGALVQRAHAIAGRHPAFPGQPIAGVVGVFVVPPDRGEGPPTPDQDTLRAVARHLSKEAAPAGIEVVAAAPRYRKIRAEVAVIIRREADAGETVRRVIDRLNQYLHPTLGGDDGQGWSFGGTLRYPTLLRLLTNVNGVSAVPRLNFVVDGLRNRSCADYPIAEDALFWPELHQVIIFEVEEGT